MAAIFNLYGGGQQIGLTLISKAYNDTEQREVVQRIKEFAKENAIEKMETEGFYQVVGYDARLGKGLNIAGQTINWNVVYAYSANRLYLGTPIIYQTY